MPKKVCPRCGTQHGVRKLVCECGHDFACKRSGKAAIAAPHPAYPEPGVGIFQVMKGMPPVSPPEPLPNGPISASIVKDVVSYEGLGFTLYSYIPADRIDDPVLRKLWVEARAAMQTIVEYLEEVPFPEYE